MTQDTRKDPRAKVLSMTVRYKSATLDEFIEHHSHDVSRGGMFIKTPSPFPPGTLLKFEVRIHAEQRVMQGVGRVVWKREASESSEARPAGMGVKFIKIDDESRKVIDQLVTARGDAKSNFEQENSGSLGDQAAGPAALRAVPAKPAPVSTSSTSDAAGRAQRKATMIGLGAMPDAPTTSTKVEPSDAFFPATDTSDMPPPEDRTVMKQTAELLQDALREAGGSLEDVGTSASPPRVEPKPVEPPRFTEPKPEPHAAIKTAVAPKTPEPETKPATKRAAAAVESAAEVPPATPKSTEAVTATPPRTKPAETKSESVAPISDRTEATRPRAEGVNRAVVSRAVAASAASRTETRARPAPAAAAKEGDGGGKFVAVIAVLAIMGGIGYYVVTQQTGGDTTANPAPTAAPEPPAAPPVNVAPPAPTPAEPPPAAAPAETAAPAAPPEAPAPSASASAVPSAAAAPTPPASSAPPVAAAPEPPKPAAVPVAKPRKPKAAKPESAPTEAAPAEPAPAAPPAAAAPEAPAPAPAPTPKPAATPKPAPAPASEGDNPY